MKTELPSAPCFLGIECGGSRTIALLARDLSQMKRVEAGPANLKLLSDADLVRHFRLLSGYFSKPDAVGVGMAGARTGADRERILKAAAQVWPKVPCSATHDLEIALLAAELQEQQQKENGKRLLQGNSRNGDLSRALQPPAYARVLVLSGTGSCCYGRTRAGRSAQVGGWGHILGDKGSGYEIGLRALKAVVYYYDRQKVWSPLGQRILRVLQLNEPNDLIGWSQQATKTDIAALAIEVFQAWAKRDKIASDILGEAARSLAEDAAACAQRLTRRGARVQFVLAGSVLLRQGRFAEQMINHLHGLWPDGVVTSLASESVWGAVELARQHYQSLRRVAAGTALDGAQTPAETFSTAPARASRLNSALTKNFTLPESSRLSPTEQRNPRSTNLDKLPLARMISIMLSEDAKIPAAILVKGSVL